MAEGLTRSYGAKTAVDHLDLEVRKGEVYGFLGPNGAGKSTLVRMLCTLLAPSAGRAVVAGFDVAQAPMEVRTRIGAALQEAALDGKQTGRELLVLQGRLFGMRSAQVRKRLEQVLDLVDIGSAIDRRIATYSGGMKRRLDLAAALVHEPEVLFLDEPTTGLDPWSRTKVWEEVRRLNAEMSMTIFLTTQYLEEADALAGRIGIISGGRLVAQGPPEVLKREVGLELISLEVDGEASQALAALGQVRGCTSVAQSGSTFTVGTPDASGILSELVLGLTSAGLRVKSLEVRTPSLDDVFFATTGSAIDAGALR
ncbi:MAG: ATP-binding cassette domain-containing protein [Acidimicrobiales bacterium]|jgi:ABC-2 type transport system ATP-binding protein|nr:ATP-binding cassette domain-containing protein [Actinomycetota bacterium]